MTSRVRTGLNFEVKVWVLCEEIGLNPRDTKRKGEGKRTRSKRKQLRLSSRISFHGFCSKWKEHVNVRRESVSVRDIPHASFRAQHTHKKKFCGVHSR